mgnify:CR=1 FL=1
MICTDDTQKVEDEKKNSAGLPCLLNITRQITQNSICGRDRSGELREYKSGMWIAAGQDNEKGNFGIVLGGYIHYFDEENPDPSGKNRKFAPAVVYRSLQGEEKFILLENITQPDWRYRNLDIPSGRETITVTIKVGDKSYQIPMPKVQVFLTNAYLRDIFDRLENLVWLINDVQEGKRFDYPNQQVDMERVSGVINGIIRGENVEVDFDEYKMLYKCLVLRKILLVHLAYGLVPIGEIGSLCFDYINRQKEWGEPAAVARFQECFLTVPIPS